MTIYNGELIVAGVFDRIGETAAAGIARWDGMRWQPLGDGLTAGVNTSVEALTVFQGQLYVGGFFSSAGGQ